MNELAELTIKGQADGTSSPEPLVVSIDLSDIVLK
jgi:hypothetical protein